MGVPIIINILLLTVTIITIVNIPIIFNTSKEGSTLNTLTENTNYDATAARDTIPLKIFVYFYIN